MTSSATKEIIDRIEQILRPLESISYAFLFGSALKHLRDDSDIDILVGGDIDFTTRLDLTARLTLSLTRDVDLVPVAHAYPEIVLKAMSTGLPVFIKDANAFKQDYFGVFRAYDDAAGLRRIRAERLKRVYANG